MSIATRASGTRMRSRRATHKSASGSSNGGSDLPKPVDPDSIGLNRIARPDRNGIRVDPGSIGLNRIARPDHNGTTVDPGSLGPNRIVRQDRNGTRLDPSSIGLSRIARPDRNGIRADRNRNRERIAVNDDLRVARSRIGAARVGSKRRRSRATRDPNRLRRPVPKSPARSRARVKGRSLRLRRVRPDLESRRPGLRNAGAPISQESADGSCVITHVVLLRPRAGLSADERTGIVDAFRTAVRTIPSIRRVRLGKRVKHGRQYEQSMRVDYEYAALLDFDDVGGLQAYLEHPAHEALATHVFQALDAALIYDFELDEGESGLEKLA